MRTRAVIIVSILFGVVFAMTLPVHSQENALKLENIYSNRTFRSKGFGPVRWMKDGKGYSTVETNKGLGGEEIVRYDAQTGERSVLVAAKQFSPESGKKPLGIDNYEWSDDNSQMLIFTNTKKVWPMLGAGIIGVFIASRATFAAEVGGCMAETGSGSGMASAAIAAMAGRNAFPIDRSRVTSAAKFTRPDLRPGNCVEAPCLGRNVMAATNAVACANMALSNYEHLIPLDEVIDTRKEVGDRIHNTLRCTNLGGLSITKAATKIGQTLIDKRAIFKSC